MRFKNANKRKRLTFEEKCKLVDEVKSGASKQFLLEKYGICDRTYKRLIACESNLRNVVKGYEYLKKKASVTADNMVLDATVLEWFKQMRDRGDQISGPMIRKKALILNEKMNGPQTFKASSGWFDGFKKRHGIRMKGKKWFIDRYSDATEFSEIFDITSLTPSEAFDCIEKVKIWLKSRADCTKEHRDYIQELQNLITECDNDKCTIPEFGQDQ